MGAVADLAVQGAVWFADPFYRSGAVDRLSEHMKVLRIADDEAAALRGTNGQTGTHFARCLTHLRLRRSFRFR